MSVNDLPPEIRTHIGRFLDEQNLCKASTLSSEWHRDLLPVKWHIVRSSFPRELSAHFAGNYQYIRSIDIRDHELFRLAAEYCTTLEDVELSVFSTFPYGDATEMSRSAVEFLGKQNGLKKLNLKNQGMMLWDGSRSVQGRVERASTKTFDLVRSDHLLRHLEDHCPKLQDLRLSRVDFMDYFEDLVTLKSVNVLTYIQDGLVQHGMYSVLKSVPNLTTLQLRLSNALVDCRPLAQILQSRCPHLVHLDLYVFGNPLKDRQASVLIGLLEGLITLKLARVNFGPKSRDALMTHMETLEVFQISTINQQVFASSGPLNLSSLFTEFRKLKELRIRSALVTTDGLLDTPWICTDLKVLECRLSCRPVLPTLVINNLSPGRRLNMILDQISKSLTSLETLEIQMYYSRKTGIVPLTARSGLHHLKELKELKTLTGLNFDRQFSSVEDLPWIAENLKKLRLLRVMLPADGPNRRAMKVFKKVRPEMEIHVVEYN